MISLSRSGFQLLNVFLGSRRRRRGSISRTETFEDRVMLTTFTVNTDLDVVDSNDGLTSLREAVTAANESEGADDIVFDGVDNLVLLNGDLVITEDLVIDGGISGVSIDAAGNSRIFTIETTDEVTLAGLELTGGDAEDGGAIYNNGSRLGILDSVLTGNTASGTAGSGGAIFNLSGTVFIANSVISSNSAVRAGGGIEDQSNEADAVTLVDVNLDNNDALGGTAPGNGGGLHITGSGGVFISGGTVNGNFAAREGGGLWNGTGLMTIEGTEIDGNVASGAAADDGGGGIFNNGGAVEILNSSITNNVADGAAGSGGGILNVIGGTISANESLISFNTAVRAGGGIEDQSNSQDAIALTDVNLDNNGVGSAPGNGGGLHVTGSGNVSIKGGTVNGNFAAREGGGLWNGTGLMSIYGTEIDGNIASGDAADDGGGGIFNNGGTVSITKSSITNNLADGVSGSGGGIFSTDGEVTVTKSTISGNDAVRAGGGIEIVDGQLTFERSWLTDNSVSSNPGNGGGLHVTGIADVLINRSDVVGNFASSEGGGLWNQVGSTMTVYNSKVEGNIASGNSADNGGGGIFNNGGTLNVVKSTVAYNVANGTSGSGGGIFSTDGAVSIERSSIKSNDANRAGGGIEVIDGDVEINKSSLQGNRALGNPGNGGAFHATGSADVLIEKTKVVDNFAENEGGGLWAQNGGNMTVIKSKIDGNWTNGDGGGVFVNGGVVSIIQSKIMRNYAQDNGGGLFVRDGGDVEVSKTKIQRNVAVDGRGGGVFNDGDLTLERSKIKRNDASGRSDDLFEGLNGDTDVDRRSKIGVFGSF
ncbi:CSLREA domain-containing protein [Thalassoglobus sp. JC818]|uniref:beta strand repeat-containing protein n=1 Tax=Thalassoglobus sp. JC818 TaxID=3232136 RepID=UPI0034588EDA